MASLIKSPRNTLILLAACIVIAALILLTAPAEQKLGHGITSIYVHVAFIWTGLSGLMLSVFLGVIVAVKGSARLQSWTQSIATVGLIAFCIGIGLSMIAARVNWGGVPLDEPRFRASFNVVAVTIIVLVLATWISNIRLRGMLYIIPAFFILQNVLFTRLVLHPPTPTVTVSVGSIQMVFFALFGLCMLCCAWMVGFMQSHRSNVLSV